MRHELEEINTPIEEQKKPTRFLAITLATIALILALYAAIIGTHNFYYVLSHKNQFEQSTVNLTAQIQQHSQQIQTLQSSISALQNELKQKTEKLPNNVQKIFSEIASINQQIQAMSVFPKRPTLPLNDNASGNINPAAQNNTALSWRERILNSVKHVKDLFIVRHIDQNSLPFISQNDETLMKQNIAIQLSMAQWALLHHDKKVYQTSLKTVSTWLIQYFSLSDETKMIVEKLNTLQQAEPTSHD